MKTLERYMQGKECEGFAAIPHYIKDGDMLTYFSKDVRCHTKQIDDLLSIYYSDETDEIIGINLKGIGYYCCS